MATTHASNSDDVRLKTDLKTLELEGGFEAGGEAAISPVEGRRILRRVDLQYVIVA